MSDSRKGSSQPQASARPAGTEQPRAGPSGAQLSARNPRRTSDANQGGGKKTKDKLLEAVIQKDLPRFEKLVSSRKADNNYKYGRPHLTRCLEKACGFPDSGEFVRVLLRHVKPNLNVVIPEPIHYAAEKGQEDSLRVLLADKRTKVHAINNKGQTALHVACANVSAKHAEKYLQCIELLVSKMTIAELNKPDSNGFTAFHTLVLGPGRKQPVKKKQHSMDARANEDQSSKAGEERGLEDRSRGEDDMQARERLAELWLRMNQGVLDVDSVRANGRTAREDAELRFPKLRTLLPAPREQPRADPHMALVNALHDGRIDLFRALLQQTDGDGNPALDPNHYFGYPLHTTCLELACGMAFGAEFVQALLEAGADPNVPNQRSEKYPIHMACEKGHYKELEALLQYSKVFVDVNYGDKSGNTPLHCIVDQISDDKRREPGRRKCLEILLTNDNLDVTKTNKEGNTALLLAVQDGNEAVVKTFLGAENYLEDLYFDALSVRMNDRSLRDVIAEQFPQLSELLQQPDTMDTLQCRRGERTKLLFENLNPIREEDFVKQLKEFRLPDLSKMNDKKFTLLQRAAQYGLVKAARALLQAGVDPNGTFSGNSSPPGVIASSYRHVDFLQILAIKQNFNINATDSKGNTALHYATRADKNMETVILLLRHGADMTIRNKLGKSPFGKEQVESLLDQCVNTNGNGTSDVDYELLFDYRLLAPGAHVEFPANNGYALLPCNDERVECEEDIPNEDDSTQTQKLLCEMTFLNMISRDPGLSTLLEHPVAFSFLQLKWRRLRYLSYINLSVYMCFMFFLNIYIVSGTNNLSVDKGNGGSVIEKPHYFLSFLATLFFWVILALREIIQFLADAEIYKNTLENYLDWAVLIFSLLSLVLPFTGVSPEVTRTMNVFTIMLSCIEMLLLLGRVSRFAKYIEMLKMVIKYYILLLLSYSVIIVAFGLSFFTLLSKRSEHEQQMAHNSSVSGMRTKEEPADFGTWYMSIVMILMMMVGQLDFTSLPNRSAQSIILFILFVLVATLLVMLLNLLTGLTVSDTPGIKNAAQQVRLRSHVGVLLRSERILVKMHNWESLPIPRCLRERLRRAAVLFPNAGPEGRYCRVRPNRTCEMALGEGEGERCFMKHESLDRATQILSRRGAVTAQGLKMAEVDPHVQEILNKLKILESRSALRQ